MFKSFKTVFYNLLEDVSLNKIIVYPGRFQPFHKGHYQVYEFLKNKFKPSDVFIATSNKVELPKSPFNFEQKKLMAEKLGVEPNKIVQVKNPYAPLEIAQNYDQNNTVIFFAVSQKDMAEDPRFTFRPKKDGSAPYLQPYKEGINLEPLSKHGYVITTPTFIFKVLNKPVKSASEIRQSYISGSDVIKKRIIKDLYGNLDPQIYNLWNEVLVNNNEV